MKIGNTSFNVEAIKNMTFSEFEKTYKGKYNGTPNLKEVFKKLGGKVVNKIAKKDNTEDK
jgi:hypothetical protein